MQTLDTGHWKLDTRHWTLDGHWTLDTGHWTLVTRQWTVVTGLYSLVTGHWQVNDFPTFIYVFHYYLLLPHPIVEGLLYTTPSPPVQSPAVLARNIWSQGFRNIWSLY